MNQKELTKTFMIIIEIETLWSPWFIQKYFSTVRGKGAKTELESIAYRSQDAKGCYDLFACYNFINYW